MTPWSSLHLYVHGDRAAKDEFLLDVLAPAADRLVADGHATGWFFLRYWEGGPHIRFRVRDADPERLAELAEEARRWLAKNPPEISGPDPERFYAGLGGLDGAEALARYGWHEHGEVVEAEYVPEADRYGGADALPAAEDLFVASTQVALAAMAASRDGTKRLSVAFTLLVAFTAGVCENTAVEVTMLRRYVLSSRYNTVDAPGVDIAVLREQAEADYAAGGERYRATAAQVRAALAAGGKANGLLRNWSVLAAEYADTLRTLAVSGDASGPASYWTVLLSQLHMVNNRMGVELAEEYRLAWLASLAAAGATLGAGFHDRGLETPARRFHEASKYFAGTIDQQLPQALPERSPSFPAVGDIGLGGVDGSCTGDTADAADKALWSSRDLLSVLAQRRSTLGRLGGEVSPEALGALLGHAARQKELETPIGDGRTLTARVRPYPSAGTCLPTRILALPVRVPGVPAALYEYVADRHVLRPVAPAPAAADLGRTSPYLDPAQPVSVDPGGVPLWLFVVGDITGIGRRYGLRGYRFLALEAGHLAQNLVLVATALGLGSTTIGAFYDDALSQLLELDGVSSSPFYIIPVGQAGPAADGAAP